MEGRSLRKLLIFSCSSFSLRSPMAAAAARQRNPKAGSSKQGRSLKGPSFTLISAWGGTCIDCQLRTSVEGMEWPITFGILLIPQLKSALEFRSLKAWWLCIQGSVFIYFDKNFGLLQHACQTTSWKNILTKPLQDDIFNWQSHLIFNGINLQSSFNVCGSSQLCTWEFPHERSPLNNEVHLKCDSYTCLPPFPSYQD